MIEIDLDAPWSEQTLIVFDTETSGGYPVGCDVVEFGAVKWYQGQVVDTLQVLIKPREPMSDFIITIHGITNEMVEKAPPMSEVALQIRNFFRGCVAVAHHAPFDLGFLAFEFERNRISLPSEPALCTSLLARKLISGVENHKLQTLVKHLKIPGGSAHRALDDSKACLAVALECFKRAEPRNSIRELISIQGTGLWWRDFSLLSLVNEKIQVLVEAIQKKKTVEMIYSKGTRRGERRLVKPLGLVRNHSGDYIMGLCLIENTNKRFYLKAIEDVQLVYTSGEGS
jgi:DNA polymerase-3 subunit epsilon